MAATVSVNEPIVSGRPAAHHGSRSLRHFLEMIAAMVVGMVLLGGAVSAGAGLVGLDYSRVAPEIDVLVMVVDMAVGMTVWMRYRRHGWRHVLEMDAAMFAPLLVLYPLLWWGAISTDALYGLSHVLMIPAMVVATRRRHAAPRRPSRRRSTEHTAAPTAHAVAAARAMTSLAR